MTKSVFPCRVCTVLGSLYTGPATVQGPLPPASGRGAPLTLQPGLSEQQVGKGSGLKEKQYEIEGHVVHVLKKKIGPLHLCAPL